MGNFLRNKISPAFKFCIAALHGIKAYAINFKSAGTILDWAAKSLHGL